MFVIGLMIGGLIGVFIMCMLQINRDNELQLENDELKMKLNVCGNTSEIWFNKCMIARGQIQKATEKWSSGLA